MSRRPSVLAVGALALAVSACSPTLSARSVAPPGRTAELTTIDGFWTIKAYRLELSRGVAIAITCDRGRPCTRVRLRSDDPAIATVHDAALAKLEPIGLSGIEAVPSGIVVVGRSPGTTRIRIDTAQGGRDVFVTVTAPPTPNPQTAAVR